MSRVAPGPPLVRKRGRVEQLPNQQAGKNRRDAVRETLGLEERFTGFLLGQGGAGAIWMSLGEKKD